MGHLVKVVSKVTIEVKKTNSLVKYDSMEIFTNLNNKVLIYLLIKANFFVLH